MRVRHHPTVDSDMSRYWQLSDQFDLCDDFRQVILTLTGDQLMRIIQAHYAHVATIQDSLRQLSEHRDLYPPRRLLGQHKALRGRP